MGLGSKKTCIGSKDEVIKVWRNADAVCLDVDSTVCMDEAIDEIANYFDVGKEVEEWTNKAMGGSMRFRDALRARLNIIQPNREKLARFLHENPPRLTHGIQELIQILHKQGVPVYLVSGGFCSVIERVAAPLNIPLSHVFANRMKFYFNGDYAGFDESLPTSDSGGKTKVVQFLKEKHGYKNLVMIGDGVTDMEACPDAFIGFGGNVCRTKVQEGAKWFVTSFEELQKEFLAQ